MSDFSPLFGQGKKTSLPKERKDARRAQFQAYMRESVRKSEEDCLQEQMTSPLFSTARKTALPPERKDAFREEFRAHMMRQRPERVPFFAKLSAFVMGHWKVSMASLALFSTVGNVGYAAETSVPGDALYAVKTNVNEPLLGIFAVTPDAKLKHDLRIVARRMREADTLIARRRLTPAAKAALVAAIERKQAQLDARIAQLQADGKDTESLEALREITEIFERHPQALLRLSLRKPALFRMLRNQLLVPEATLQAPSSGSTLQQQPGPLRRILRFLRNR